MIFASSNFLGIALSDRSITCAEISGKGDRVAVQKTATFTLPADVSLEKPEALGTALGSFLKQQGFSSSEAIVGVPARWLIAAEKDVPPSGREQMRAMLRMQAERLPLADAGELVFDYAGEHDSGKASKVLLVAMLRKQLDRIESVMEIAGVKVIAVTPTSLALASVASGRTGPASRNTSFLMLAASSAELVYQRGGMPRVLRHVAVSGNGHGLAMGPLGIELRRAVAMAPSSTNGSASNDSANEMILWDSVGLADAQIAELSERSGLKVRSGNGLAMLGVKAMPRTSRAGTQEEAEQYAPALALAMTGANRTLLPFDFTDSRLQAVKVRRFGTKALWGGIVAALIVIGLATLFVQNSLRQRELDKINADRAAQAGQLTEAKALQSQVDFVSLYFDTTRAPMLVCFRDLSNCFHDNDPMWATSFSVKESNDATTPNKLDGTLEGKTTNVGVTNEVVQRMKQNPRFTDIKGPRINPGSGRQGTGQATFNITFKYLVPTH